MSTENLAPEKKFKSRLKNGEIVEKDRRQSDGIVLDQPKPRLPPKGRKVCLLVLLHYFLSPLCV